jgi:hypothetical protein
VVVVVLLGAGVTIIGLSPPPSISVAPSGMLPMPVADAPDDPGVMSPDAAPVVALVVPQPVDPVLPLTPLTLLMLLMPPAPLMPVPRPPPSKVPMPEDDKVLTVEQAEPASGPGAGLKPPTLSWVAPSGMPACDDGVLDVRPETPSGDVAPSAEPVLGIPGAIVICADATPQPSTSINIVITVRMISSPFRCRVGSNLTRFQPHRSRRRSCGRTSTGRSRGRPT